MIFVLYIIFLFFCVFFFFNDPATTEIYTYRHPLSLHDALPILDHPGARLASVPLPDGTPSSAPVAGRYQPSPRGRARKAYSAASLTGASSSAGALSRLSSIAAASSSALASLTVTPPGPGSLSVRLHPVTSKPSRAAAGTRFRIISFP